MRLTTRSCRLGGIISARMKRWPLSGSTVGCVIGLPAFADGPVWSRKRSRWSTPPSHCLPPTTLMEQRQNSPCHCLLNTLLDQPPGRYRLQHEWNRQRRLVIRGHDDHGRSDLFDDELGNVDAGSSVLKGDIDDAEVRLGGPYACLRVRSICRGSHDDVRA